MLVLAHRTELLEQTCDKIRRANPDLKIAVEQAGRIADRDCDVVVASGDMDRDARAKALENFHAGRIQVLANCMVLTEGYDEPSVSGIILARPTKSALLYTQMIGRGTRLHPGKQNVTIVDIVDVTRDHSHTAALPRFRWAKGVTVWVWPAARPSLWRLLFLESGRRSFATGVGKKF